MAEAKAFAAPFYKGEMHIETAGLGAEGRERGRAQKMNSETDLSNLPFRIARTSNVYGVKSELFIFCASRNTIAQNQVVTEMGDDSVVKYAP